MADEQRRTGELGAGDDNEFLGRYRLDADPSLFPPADYGHIGKRAEVVALFRLLGFDDLDFRIGFQLLDLRHALRVQCLARFLLGVVPPDLGNAVLLDQRVLEPLIEFNETVVVLPEHMLRVIGCLIGDLVVLLPHRIVGNGARTRGEHFDKIGQDPFDNIGHVVRDDLRPPLDIREWHRIRIRQIEFHGLRALTGDFFLHERLGLVDERFDNPPQLIVGHRHLFRLQRENQIAVLILVQRGGFQDLAAGLDLERFGERECAKLLRQGLHARHVEFDHQTTPRFGYLIGPPWAIGVHMAPVRKPSAP